MPWRYGWTTTARHGYATAADGRADYEKAMTSRQGNAAEAPGAATRAEHYDVLAPWGERLWAACRGIERGTVAASYPEHRGCALPPFADETHLRWHPDLPDRVSGYRGPALVALVTDVETGAALNIHRTWLAAEGSAKRRSTSRADCLGDTVPAAWHGCGQTRR